MSAWSAATLLLTLLATLVTVSYNATMERSNSSAIGRLRLVSKQAKYVENLPPFVFKILSLFSFSKCGPAS